MNDKYKVAVNNIHTFGTDAIMLAKFSAPNRGEAVMDLGTGCGIIPLYQLCHFNPSYVMGMDILPEAIALFERGIELSGVPNKTKAVCADLRKPMPEFIGKFDLVTCNPPYFKKGSGYIRNGAEVVRYETCCTINDVCETSAKMLRFGGRLCLVHRPERLAEVICAMKDNAIEPKRLEFLTTSKHQHNLSLKPSLFLIEGKKGKKAGMNIIIKGLLKKSLYTQRKVNM
ncbi:MAG: methyltransferase [Oscillospiraceae bacterium]|nr:methyltransferase [Oscillospiraceae bacterium]